VPKAVSKTVRRNFISTCCGSFWCPKANTSSDFATMAKKEMKRRKRQKGIIVVVKGPETLKKEVTTVVTRAPEIEILAAIEKYDFSKNDLFRQLASNGIKK